METETEAPEQASGNRAKDGPRQEPCSPSGTVTHHAQYGDEPAFYLFIHSESGMFDVRGLRVDIPDDWTEQTDEQRLRFAAQCYRPMSWDEMRANSIDWARGQAMKMANA